MITKINNIIQQILNWFYPRRIEDILTPDAMPYIPIEQLPELIPKLKKMNKDLLLETIEKYLGKDVSQEILKRDSVPDSVACVETISLILKDVIDFPLLTYTPTLLLHLKTNLNFEGTLDLDIGNIIINATGTGNGTISGHAGFIWKNNTIASNNSLNGKFETKYTIESWKQRYRIKGGMPTYVFKLVD